MPVSLLSCEHSRRATFLSPINFSLPSIRPFRALQPETQPRILVSDTVGFIRNLPHDLVASFRSTLDEALDASLLLHVVDASDPSLRSHIQVTREVLESIDAGQLPSLLILNKIDAVDLAQEALLKREFPDAIPMSALNPKDIE